MIARHPQALPEAIHGSSARSASETLPALGQRVAGGQDHVVGIVEQVDQLEVGGEHVGSRRVVVYEGQIGLAGTKPGRDLIRLRLLHRELDLGMALVEGGHRARGESGVAALEGDEPQPSAAQAGQCGQVLLGVLDPGQYRVGVLDQHATGLGHAHAARAALHQLGARLALERRHVLRDGRLRKGQRLGRGREGSARADLAKDLHASHIKHQLSLSPGEEVFIWTDGRALRS